MPKNIKKKTLVSTENENVVLKLLFYIVVI